MNYLVYLALFLLGLLVSAVVFEQALTGQSWFVDLSDSARFVILWLGPLISIGSALAFVANSDWI